MEKLLFSMPEILAARFRSLIPARQRSKVIASLVKIEIEKREKSLYECAVAIENDQALNKEMKEWDLTLEDGLKNEPR